MPDGDAVWASCGGSGVARKVEDGEGPASEERFAAADMEKGRPSPRPAVREVPRKVDEDNPADVWYGRAAAGPASDEPDVEDDKKEVDE